MVDLGGRARLGQVPALQCWVASYACRPYRSSALPTKVPALVAVRSAGCYTRLVAKPKRNSSAGFLFRKHRGKVIIGVVAVLAILAATLLLTGGSSDAAARRQLEAEFEGAYPVSPTPTGEVIELELTATPTTMGLVDGADTALWAYNGEPGFEVRIQLGDTLEVTLRNELTVPTTLHWHGVRVPNAMDGVPGLTQDTVEAGGTFVYTFTPPDPGTFFFHSHVNSVEQIERGLYGVLVVEDREPLEYSQDLVWLVDDWSLNDQGQLDGNFRDTTATVHNGRYGGLLTVNGEENYELQVQPGERLRIRYVNASTARIYGLRFGEPSATLLAVDGLYVNEPRPADATLLSPGSRVDVDLVVPDTPGRYELVEDFGSRQITMATLVVQGDPIDTPNFEPPSSGTVPAWADALDVDIDHEFLLSLDGAEWQINGSAFMDGDPYVIEPDTFTRIRFTNNSERLHPMHLHGQFFKVLAVNGEPVDEGHFRDSVLVFSNGVVDIGIIALDEGFWALHCHILEHAAAGMTTLVHVPTRNES